jgi:hypothetical protein
LRGTTQAKNYAKNTLNVCSGNSMTESNAKVWVYLFEVKSVQSLIFESGKLREIIGASELVARLTDTSDANKDDSLLGCILQQIKENGLSFSRRAGGAVYASIENNEPHMRRFAALWELCVQQTLPGLELVRALAGGADYQTAMSAARKALQAARNQPQVHLPLAGPFVKRNPRTGRAAVRAIQYQERGAKEEVLLDELSNQKRKMEDGSALKRRFYAADEAPNAEGQVTDYKFPIDFEKSPRSKGPYFPFLGENKTVAIVHADGTGLGQLLISLQSITDTDKAQKAYRAVSEILSKAGIDAARAATEVLIKDALDRKDDVLAARPVILGGEDFSAIVRADLAIPYAEAFLRSFESASEKALTEAKETNGAFDGVPISLTKFTACAGILYVKAHQPFVRAHALAESLVGRLKTKLKNASLDGSCSALGFYRDITGSYTDASHAFEQGTIARDEKLRTMLDGYLVTGTSDAFPTLENLNKLVEFARTQPRGPMRQLLGLAESDAAQAAIRLKRIKEVSGANWSKWTALFQSFSGTKPHQDLEIFSQREGGTEYSCPLLDLATLLSVGHKPPSEENKGKGAQ